MNVQDYLVRRLSEKNMKLATAESCTGGMISQTITDVSGASAILELGICAYSNRVKVEVLGVSQAIIDEFTENSEECAEAMAKRVLEMSGADIAVSTTGIAGPTGATKKDPVGTIYIGIATKDRSFAIRSNFNQDNCNDRAEIRKRCAEYALKLTARFLEE